MENNLKCKLTLILSMAIFGTVGLFRRYIPWPSGVLACVRGIIGALFLAIIVLVRRTSDKKRYFKKIWLYLIISGALIGINWITLFEAYNYTSVATATLCYYMAPVFVIIFTPFVFKTKISMKGYLCVLCSFIGILLISGVFEIGFDFGGEIKGVIFALISAILYASVVMLNKFLDGIEPLLKTMIQIGIAGIVCVPYSLIRGEFNHLEFTSNIIIMVLIVSIVITGFTYTLYFMSIPKIDSTSIALYSYIDPVVAVIVSILVLGEKMIIFGVIGGILIIGSMILNTLDL